MRRLATMAIIGAVAAATGACASRWPRERADLVMPARTCADAQFTIYFNEGSDRLTQPAAQVIQETVRGLEGCRIDRVRVVGLADATGAPAANLSLSQRRALRTAEALRVAGAPAPTFEIGAAGDAGALTADGREDPVRRRAEVYLGVSTAN